MKSFTYAGEWWLPSKENHKIAGEATFTGDDRIKLALHGIFAHNFELGIIDSLPWYPIILGVTEAGQPITLFSCQETYSSSLSGEEDEEGGEQKYQIDKAFIGAYFTDPQVDFLQI